LVRPEEEDGPDDGEAEAVHAAEFKATVALEALRGELTIGQLVAKHGVHQTPITAWKRQAVAGMAAVSSGKAGAAEAARAAEVERLHAKIGALVVARDFSRGASGRWASAGGGG
jgi:transposase